MPLGLHQAHKGADGGGTMSQGLKGSGDRNVCTLEVPEESPKKGRPHEEIQIIPFVEKDLAKVFKIGITLGAEHEVMLIQVLRDYREIFAWEPTYMPGIDPEVSVHRRYIDPRYKPLKQRDILQQYLVVSESTLSSVLIGEEEKVYRPVCYVSQVMRRAETRKYYA
ncbi:hypothetical protein LIER_12855 [Lithospermum erythrorhizon]|uniref:Uncharacterized protein n=1 Tax=Lithospermum erythrorhizon TaxID=34254 RepID=A0AAV3PTD4_LITER